MFMNANRYLVLRAHDAGLAVFQHLLAHNAEEAGTQVVVVNSAYTSQVRSSGGAVVEKDMSVRAHRCPHCDYTADHGECRAE